MFECMCAHVFVCMHVRVFVCACPYMCARSRVVWEGGGIFLGGVGRSTTKQSATEFTTTERKRLTEKPPLGRLFIDSFHFISHTTWYTILVLI